MDTAVGAVVSDHEATSDVGRNILKRGGSVVDAAIAMTICNGVRTFHSLGIGGGTFMVIYQKGCKGSVFIDGLCTAPSRMTQPIYQENLSKNGKVCKVGIPGTIKACKVAHDLYGRLPWIDLFQPAIKMLREGFPISKAVADAFYLCETYPENPFIDTNVSPVLRNIISVFQSNDKQLRMGDIITLPNLAHTLESISELGPDYIYNSHVTETILKELKQHGGFHIVEDFQKYKALHGRALTMRLGDFTFHTSHRASGGVMIAIALNMLKGYNLTESDFANLSDKAEVCHKFLEVFRFIMPIKDQLGDPDFHDVDWIFNKATCENFAALIRSSVDDDKTHRKEYYSDVLTKTVQDGGNLAHFCPESCR